MMHICIWASGVVVLLFLAHLFLPLVWGLLLLPRLWGLVLLLPQIWGLVLLLDLISVPCMCMGSSAPPTLGAGSCPHGMGPCTVLIASTCPICMGSSAPPTGVGLVLLLLLVHGEYGLSHLLQIFV